MFQILFVV